MTFEEWWKKNYGDYPGYTGWGYQCAKRAWEASQDSLKEQVKSINQSIRAKTQDLFNKINCY
jgi:hypothetical protein